MLSQSDLQKASEFIQQIYALCTPEELTFRLASLAPMVIASEIPVYSSVDYRTRRVTHLASPQYSALSRQVIEHADDHPRFHHYVQTGDLRAYTVSDFWTQRELYQQEGLYQFDWRPLGIEEQLSISLPSLQSVDHPKRHRSLSDALNLHRTDRSFTDRDRLMLNLLLPHIIQAQQNSLAYAKTQQSLAQANQVLEQVGTILLSIEGQVKLITQRAEELLLQYFPASTDNLPDPVQGWFKYQITLLNRSDDMPAPCLPLQIEQGNQRLTIRLLSDRTQEQYLLLLEEQQIPELSIAALELIGLTKREAEVLFWVTEDKSNAEIAKILGCRNGTVRKHLEHIFEKLTVQTRTAAVVVALKRLGLFTPGANLQNEGL